MTTNKATPKAIEAPERVFLKACHPASLSHNCSWNVSKEARDSVEYVRADLARVDPPAAPAESRAQSVKELADAALLSLERIDTVKLAALGRDGDAEAVGNARRLVDRLLYEIIPLCGHEPHSPDVGDTWKERNQ